MVGRPACRRAGPWAGGGPAPPRRRARQRHRRRRSACGRSALAILRGKVSGAPVAAARRRPRPQRDSGRRAATWAGRGWRPGPSAPGPSRPGRSSARGSPARRFSSGLASGSGASTANSRAITRSTLPSTTLVGLVEGDRGHRGGGIGADARQGPQARLGVREDAAVIARHRAGAGQQVAGAGVVAKARPGGHHLAVLRGGQRPHRRPARGEVQEIGRRVRHGGLLQHDLRQPHPVGVGASRPGVVGPTRQGRSRAWASYQASRAAAEGGLQRLLVDGDHGGGIHRSMARGLPDCGRGGADPRRAQDASAAASPPAAARASPAPLKPLDGRFAKGERGLGRAVERDRGPGSGARRAAGAAHPLADKTGGRARTSGGWAGRHPDPASGASEIIAQREPVPGRGRGHLGAGQPGAKARRRAADESRAGPPAPARAPRSTRPGKHRSPKSSERCPRASSSARSTVSGAR